MKSSFAVSCLALAGLLLPCPGFAAATPPSPAPAAAAAASLEGSYAGEWKGPESTGGAIELKLTPASAAGWSAEMAFTFEGTRVPTKFRSARVEGSKVELTFSWEVDGTTTVCQLTGDLNESRLEGRYKTDTSGAGTWSARRL